MSKEIPCIYRVIILFDKKYVEVTQQEKCVIEMTSAWANLLLPNYVNLIALQSAKHFQMSISIMTLYEFASLLPQVICQHCNDTSPLLLFNPSPENVPEQLIIEL